MIDDQESTYSIWHRASVGFATRGEIYCSAWCYQGNSKSGIAHAGRNLPPSSQRGSACVFPDLRKHK